MEPNNPHDHPTDSAAERDTTSPSPPPGSDSANTTISPQQQDPQSSHIQPPGSSQWWSTYQKNRKSLGKEKKVFCQVPTCLQDLSSRQYKDYHRRYRICPPHCSAIMVEIEGVGLRFCQQCAYFHSLDKYDDKKKSCREMLGRIRARRAATKETKKKEDEEDYAKAAAAALDSGCGSGGGTTTTTDIIGGNGGFPPPHYHGDNNNPNIMPGTNHYGDNYNGDHNSNHQMMMTMIQYNNQCGTHNNGTTGYTGTGNGSTSLLPDTTFSRNYNTVAVADVSDAFRGGPHPLYGGNPIPTCNNNNAFIPTTNTNPLSSAGISIMNHQQYHPTQTVFNDMLQTFASNHCQTQQQQQKQQMNMYPLAAPDGSGGLFFTATDTNNAATTSTQILTQDLLTHLSDEIKNDPNILIDALVMLNDLQKKEQIQQEQQERQKQQEQQRQLSPSTMQLEEEPSNGQLLAVDGSGTHTNSKSNSDVNGGLY